MLGNSYAQPFRWVRSKHYSDLCWRLAANVVAAAFKFGDGLVPKLFQCFLARSLVHWNPYEIIFVVLCNAGIRRCRKSIAAFKKGIIKRRLRGHDVPQSGIRVHEQAVADFKTR
jgi:hypothetical protein